MNSHGITKINGLSLKKIMIAILNIVIDKEEVINEIDSLIDFSLSISTNSMFGFSPKHLLFISKLYSCLKIRRIAFDVNEVEGVNITNRVFKSEGDSFHSNSCTIIEACCYFMRLVYLRYLVRLRIDETIRLCFPIITPVGIASHRFTYIRSRGGVTKKFSDLIVISRYSLIGIGKNPKVVRIMLQTFDIMSNNIIDFILMVRRDICNTFTFVIER